MPQETTNWPKHITDHNFVPCALLQLNNTIKNQENGKKKEQEHVSAGNNQLQGVLA